LRRYSTFNAFGEIAARDIECSDRGITKGARGVDDEFKKWGSA